MQHYIEMDDKLIITDGNLEVVKNDEEIKELVQEQNKLETIQKEIQELEKKFQKQEDFEFKVAFANGAFTIFTVFFIGIIDIIIAYYSHLSSTVTIQATSLINLNIITGILVIGGRIISKLDKKNFNKMKEDHNSEKELLLKLERDSKDKIKSLIYKKEHIEDITINKSNDKEILKSIKEELESLKEEKKETNKEKKIGTK